MDQDARENAGEDRGEDTAEFEAFLRQFQPSRPRPLPARRRVAVPLATAAVLLLGAAVAMRVSWTETDADDRQSTAAPVATDAAPGNTPGAGGSGQERGAQTAVISPLADAAQANTPGDAGEAQDRVAQPEAVGPPAATSPGLPVLEFRPNEGQSSGRGQAAEPLEPVAKTTFGQENHFRIGGAIRPPTKLYDVSPVSTPFVSGSGGRASGRCAGRRDPGCGDKRFGRRSCRDAGPAVGATARSSVVNRRRS